ncbi:hypothetical protein B0H10DRAFT_1796272 [Mycena sp. CBHHK59/15]|nr:hypothetical protein B0H10DRAFT_1796272 [Mycena sp. CBHHK59/15]
MQFSSESLLSCSKSSVACAVVLGYLCVVRSLRWRRYNAIHTKYSSKFKAGTLSPDEAQEVVQVSYLYDMPLLSEYSLAFALFKTYGIPSISKLLASTQELGSKELVAKRYADTDILISTMVSCPITGLSMGGKPGTDPRAMIAVARTNWLHSKYKISNEDYLYTLGLFTFEPAVWAAKYAWRAHSPLERYASYVYWAEVGRKMNIKDIPETVEDFQAWCRAYEEEYMVPAQSNHDVAKHTTDELLSIVPEAFGLKSFFEGVSVSLLEDRVRTAMMQPKPPQYYGYLVSCSLGVVALINRYLLLPRRKPQAGVQVDLPKIDSQSAPRLYPTRFTSKPWYKPQGQGLGYLYDRLMVLVGRHDSIPGPEYRCDGYRLQELGPLRFEKEGHEQVLRMASELQGCPIADCWKECE